MDIRIDDLSGPEVKQILTEHLEDMFAASPPECVFALDLDGLKNQTLPSGRFGKIANYSAVAR